MNVRSVFFKFEMFVLGVLLLSFLCLLPNDEPKQTPVSDSWEFFIDFNETNCYDGTEPEFVSGNVGPWDSFDAIDWNAVNSAVSSHGSAIIYVFAEKDENCRTVNSPIDPHDGATAVNNVTFLGVKSSLDSSYWPAGYITPNFYPIVNANNCEVVELNVSDNITFQNFEIEGSDNEEAIYVHSAADNATFTNCKISCCGSNSYAFRGDNSDNITIVDCDLFSMNYNNYDIVYFSYCDDITMTDCYVLAQESCYSFMHNTNCEDGVFKRNRFHSYDEVSIVCYYGILSSASTNMNFETNSVFGYCLNAAVYDEDSCDEFKWNNNTIYNCYISGTSVVSGVGYYGDGGTSGNNVLSFRNNVIYASSYMNYGYAIYIDNTFSYWQPASGYFDHNCYYRLASSSYFGYKDSTDYDDINTWMNSCYDADSYFVDPCLMEGYHIDPANTPDEVKWEGKYISIDYDIEKGLIPTTNPSTKVSIGCDQQFFVEYSTTTANVSVNSATNPVTVNIGSSGSPVSNPFYFNVGMYIYGAPLAYLNYIDIDASTCYTYGSTMPVSFIAGAVSYVDFLHYYYTVHEWTTITLGFVTEFASYDLTLYFDGYFN